MTTVGTTADPVERSTPLLSFAAQMTFGDVRLIQGPNASVGSSVSKGRESTGTAEALEVLTPLPEIALDRGVPSSDTTPIQIWEGEVLSFDPKSGDIDARLRAKFSPLPDHDATISAEWIHDQDRELVKPGAVFYITLYRSRQRGSLKNSQEIRFRRTPAWSNLQLARVDEAAAALHGKIRTPRFTDAT